jgi:muconolactone delta-isomerase
MPSVHPFLLELPADSLDAAGIQALAARSRQAAEAMRREGLFVRFLRAIYVPEDGRCFLLFEADSAADATAAAGRAGIAAAEAAAAIPS